MYITVQDISQSVLPYEKTAVGVSVNHSRVQSPDSEIYPRWEFRCSVCLSVPGIRKSEDGGVKQDKTALESG
jgi:hypothetical protein